jgi:hypothetical protein
LVRRKKKLKAIGFPAPFRQQLAMKNTEIDDMDIDLDDNDLVSLSKSFQNIGHIS